MAASSHPSPCHSLTMSTPAPLRCSFGFAGWHQLAHEKGWPWSVQEGSSDLWPGIPSLPLLCLRQRHCCSRLYHLGRCSVKTPCSPRELTDEYLCPLSIPSDSQLAPLRKEGGHWARLESRPWRHFPALLGEDSWAILMIKHRNRSHWLCDSFSRPSWLLIKEKLDYFS